MSNTPSERQVLGFAHRGGRAHARDNTIEAFVTACRMGAHALETDIWLTRDRRAVIDHDGIVRTGLRRRSIAESTLEELPQHVPTLGDLQDAVGAQIDLSIDVKDVEAAAAIVEDRATAGAGALERTWLCHHDPTIVATWRRLDPQIRLVASIRRTALVTWSFARLAEGGIEVVNLPHRHWTPPLVRDCHDAGLLAFAWGVQRTRRMRRLVGWGIDGIYSDHTDRMVAVLRATRSD